MNGARNVAEEVRFMEKLLFDLVSRDYPPESLATYWKKDGELYDVVVIDPKTGELIAVIKLEFPNKLMASSAGVRESIRSYLKLKKRTNIPMFIVGNHHSGFNVSQFVPRDNSETGTFVPLRRLPNYEVLRRSSLGERRKDTIDAIHVICWVYALVILAILLLDLFNWFKFTVFQMSLLGTMIALNLIPYANKLKIFNIEFERKS